MTPGLGADDVGFVGITRTWLSFGSGQLLESCEQMSNMTEHIFKGWFWLLYQGYIIGDTFGERLIRHSGMLQGSLEPGGSNGK